ncbi:HDIG domain-containing metalloprotein [Opitutus sp. ER46]|uniref:HD family phosphohydrolase n=1 Tax=Opitutus sp. ER46 TaxID=2161864 RepID=UPI000D318787|nr:HDIG domain-containing metalloprotein [Opitutus sp. ER46]PTY00532.1 phosphohydrolase [Opitutus sp. ER46]
MSLRNQLKLLLGGLRARQTGRPPPVAPAAWSEFLERSRLVSALIFIITVAAIVLISSAGVNTLNVPVLPNQVATTHIIATTSFTYESAEKTKAAQNQYADRVPPVYRIDTEPLRRFEIAARALLADLDTFELTHPANAPAPAPLSPAATDRHAELGSIADAFNARGNYHVTPDDVASLLTIEPRLRAAIFENGVATLRDIYAEGVVDSALGGVTPGSAIVFQIQRPNGTIGQRSVQSMEDALTLLRVSLATDTVSRPATQAVFRVFRFGLTPNIVFDRAATRARQVAAINAVKPVMVSVSTGQTIIEPGDRVTPEQYEMYTAYRRYLLSTSDAEFHEGLTLYRRLLLVLAMVVASLIYIRIEDPETLRNNVRCGLLALVVILNLALVRGLYSLGGAEFFVRDGSWASTLPYVAPTAIAPLIIAILIDAGSGIFMALLVSIFTGVIYGNRLDLLVMTYLASLVTIYLARDARSRRGVVRAGGAGGLTIAAFALLIGFADQLSYDTIGRQMVAGLVTGLFTGVVVVGFLPILETLFKRTTDITLLELTDYNHPLLRHMQLEAPGTYHHSLVVAQLSENAASVVGANPLLARVCALFHDVGKTVNPQFFAENQRERGNPHDNRDPLESARIIRQHVTDGVDLAHKHNLPRAIADVIQQHHGTTLVRYFYHRALERAQPAANGTRAIVDEAPFRYDGPRPVFKESAIISMADAVEASARSLREMTPEKVHELIDRIINERIAEGQLDNAPLTLEEITRVKNSFQFTLVNMLHARMAYPTVSETAPQPARA